MQTTLFLLFSLMFSHSLFASEAIGSYSKGSLKEGDSILERPISIHKLFLARKKFFATDEMHSVLADASEYLRREFPDAEIFQIGDLSAIKGGSAPGHSSHQNGLDVDVVYLTLNKRLQSPEATYWEEDFIVNNKVSSNFHTERNFKIFHELVHRHPVQRIFVDELIKKHLCAYTKTQGIYKQAEVIETLRRLRPLDLHRTHFHVRLRCPESDRECTPQAEVPAGDGCV